MLLKQESLPLPRNLALGTFGKLLIVFSTKAIPPLVNGPEVLSSASDKVNCLLKISLEILILMNQISLYFFFPSRTNMKLLNFSVTPKLVKVLTNLGLPKVLVLYSSGGYKELWAWTFIHTSGTLQYVSEILFSRLVEGLISGHYI